MQIFGLLANIIFWRIIALFFLTNVYESLIECHYCLVQALTLFQIKDDFKVSHAPQIKCKTIRIQIWSHNAYLYHISSKDFKHLITLGFIFSSVANNVTMFLL